MDRKHRLLADMGIDWYRLRPDPRELLVVSADSEDRSGRAGGVAASDRESPSPVESRQDSVPAVPEVPPDAAETADRVPHVEMALVALSSGKTVLIASQASFKSHQRLLRDVVVAMGEAAKPQPTAFAWPPRGGEFTDVGMRYGADAAERALNAFVQARIDEIEASALVLCDDVADSLNAQSYEARVVGLPPLEQLALDSSAKRDLWRRLCE